MKIVSLVVALMASFLSLCSLADVPMIRFASGSPFKNGKCVEAVWAKADVCTRFVEVNKNDVALDPSEVSILFDERNLYVALKGCFDPQYDRGDVKKSIGSVNNFEFFLKPPAGEYLHVIVDEFGRLYVGKGKTAYGETMAMSGEWIYRASGKDYQILQCSARNMKPSTRYTLVVRARSFGAGSALRVIEMARGRNGKVHEAWCVTTDEAFPPELDDLYRRSVRQVLV